jgi:hypothetical protein
VPPVDHLRRFRTRRATLLSRGDVVGYSGRLDTACAQLAPHVLATAPLGDHSSDGRYLVLDTIRYLQARGDSSGSRAVSAQLLDRWREVLGPDHPDTLTAASRLTLDVMQSGEVQSAHILGENSLQRSRRVLGPDHPITLYLTRATQAGPESGDVPVRWSHRRAQHSTGQDKAGLHVGQPPHVRSPRAESSGVSPRAAPGERRR